MNRRMISSCALTFAKILIGVQILVVIGGCLYMVILIMLAR